MRQRILTGSFSAYLDIVRLGSAVAVVAHHAVFPNLGGVGLFFFGLDAVAVFFVLSGLVISTITETRETDAASYFAARLSRLWSVLLPALLLTFLFDYLGSHIAPDQYHASQQFVPYVLTALFANQVWFIDAAPGTNIVVWSLAFEAWYYLLFGVATFCGRCIKWAFAVVILCIVGPKVLLLAPAWLLGIAVKTAIQNDVGRRFPWPMLLISIAGFFVFEFLLQHKAGGGGWLLEHVFHTSPDILGSSAGFIRFNGIAVLIAINFVAMYYLLEKKPAIFPAITRLSNYTYSIYLLHLPAMTLIAALTFDLPKGPLRAIYLSALAIAVSIGLGGIIERGRRPMRAWFARIFSHRMPPRILQFIRRR